MPVAQEFRDRDDVEVDVLDALVARNAEGMTVFELRSCVDADIGSLEAALNELHRDGLISVEGGEQRSVILPAEHVVPDPDADEDRGSFAARIRRGMRRINRIVRRERHP